MPLDLTNWLWYGCFCGIWEDVGWMTGMKMGVQLCGMRAYLRVDMQL
jgi:hypothetical protein